MDFLLEALTNWLKEMLVGGIMSNLSGMFDSVNQQVVDGGQPGDQPSRPDSMGTRVTPIRATPPPATSCLMPCDFTDVR